MKTNVKIHYLSSIANCVLNNDLVKKIKRHVLNYKMSQFRTKKEPLSAWKKLSKSCMVVMVIIPTSAYSP